jgi:uncharacterized protein YdhG (YjbR/CyaY superfamily)
MAAKKPTSIDAYIAALPDGAKPVATELRALIHATARGATERISYDMPTFDLKGQPLIYFGVWKKHIGIYPATGRMVARFGDSFAPYTLGKGTIQFPLNAPMPLDLIRQIVAFRVSEVESAG